MIAPIPNVSWTSMSARELVEDPMKMSAFTETRWKASSGLRERIQGENTLNKRS